MLFIGNYEFVHARVLWHKKKTGRRKGEEKTQQTLLLCIGNFIDFNKWIKPSHIRREKDCKVFIIIISYTNKSSHRLSIFLLNIEFLQTRGEKCTFI
jgi:hypothetical protein